MKINKELMYRNRLQAIYFLYDTGQISWDEYVIRRKALNRRYE